MRRIPLDGQLRKARWNENDGFCLLFNDKSNNNRCFLGFNTVAIWARLDCARRLMSCSTLPGPHQRIQRTGEVEDISWAVAQRADSLVGLPTGHAKSRSDQDALTQKTPELRQSIQHLGKTQLECTTHHHKVSRTDLQKYGGKQQRHQNNSCKKNLCSFNFVKISLLRASQSS